MNAKLEHGSLRFSKPRKSDNVSIQQETVMLTKRKDDMKLPKEIRETETE